MLSKEEIIAKIKGDVKSLIPADWVRIEVEQGYPCSPSAKVDLLLKVSAHKKSIDLVAEVIAKSSRASFRNKIDQIKINSQLCQAFPLIIAPYLNPEERAYCHEHQIFFMDLSGNQWLCLEGVLIQREGFKNKFPEMRWGRSPFSDKASLIIRELIANYGKTRGVRELANLLKLSPGFVSKIVIELEERGYIEKSIKGLHLKNPEELIAEWVNRYNIKDNQQYKYFLPVLSADEVLERIRALNLPESGYALSAQAGANLIYPYASYDVVHVYAEDESMRDFFIKSLQLEAVESGENVILMEPKYKKSALYRSRKVKCLRVVSDLQLYLDLYHYPKRGREQAEKIYDSALSPLFKE